MHFVQGRQGRLSLKLLLLSIVDGMLYFIGNCMQNEPRSRLQQPVVDRLGGEALCTVPHFQHLPSVTEQVGDKLTLATSATCWKYDRDEAWRVISSVGEELGALWG